MNLLEKMQSITTFIFDMDGVLTDGSLIITPEGDYLRTMDIKDGYALQLAVKAGFNVWIITGSSSEACKQRFAYLGITNFFQKAKNKVTTMQALMAEHNVAETQILYMGDDMPDLAPMQMVAIAACPADAVADIKTIANYISPINGGKGCARDVIEKVMKLQGKWQSNKQSTASI